MSIDVRQSIDRGRIIESNVSGDKRIETVFSYIVGLFFTSIPLIVCGLIITKSQWTAPALVVACIMLTIGLISLYGLCFKGRLLKIHGTTDKTKNKTVMKDILSVAFPKNVFVDTGDVWTSRSFDKVGVIGKRNNKLTVIYSNDAIFCNGELIGRQGIHSTFHSLCFLRKFIGVRKAFEMRVTRKTSGERNYA
jgi:hypothetical protein